MEHGPAAARALLARTCVLPADEAAACASIAMLEGRHDDALALLGTRTESSALSAVLHANVVALTASGPPQLAQLAPVDPRTPLGAMIAYHQSETAIIAGDLELGVRLPRQSLAAGLDLPAARAWIRLALARGLLHQGRFEEVDTLLHTMWPSASAAQRPAIRAMRCLAAGLRGRTAEAEIVARQIAADLPHPYDFAARCWAMVTAMGLSAAGRAEAGAALLYAGGDDRALSQHPNALRTFCLDILIESSLMAGDLSTATHLLEVLDTLCLDTNPLLTASRESSRARCALARRSGHPEGLGRARTTVRDIGAEVDAARLGILLTLLESADLPPGACVDEIASRAISTGNREVAAWARDRLRTMGVVMRHDQRSLTPTQQIVARLAASGMRNRDIAQLLVLSPRTVEGHIAAILDALGATRRTDIVARVSAEDRTPAPGPPLTARQRDIARLVADGLTNVTIGQVLGISEKAVEKHVRALFTKYDVRSRTALARRVRGGVST